MFTTIREYECTTASNDISYSHLFIPSYSRTLVPSYPHPPLPSYPHTLVLSYARPKTGFTLLEALISLSILLTFVVPLTTFIYRNHSAADSEKALTGICLLEQESALIKAFPDQAIPVKRRTINGREWIIKTETAGTGLIQYRMAASDGIKTRASLVFLGNSSDEKK